MKKVFISLFCIALIILSALKADDISDFLVNKINSTHSIVLKDKNKFAKEASYKYVSLTSDFVPYSYQELLNIIYTVLDSGWETFTFYCPSEYSSCVNDIANLSDDRTTLSYLNNFVHPYNTFSFIDTTIYEMGEVNLKITHLYTPEKVEKIEKAIDEVMVKAYDKEKSNFDNIKNIHDYIINNTRYDEGVNNNTENEESSNAYGVLYNHLATCNGYTDTMAIILNRMNVDNYKISSTDEAISYDSKGHIWNAVFVNNKWSHLDLTWDDPISDTKEDYLLHKYFLVSNSELKKADSGQIEVEEHNFKQSVYLEFNDSINATTAS